MKRQNDRILKEELPRSVGAQYATGDQWRNNSRKNEGMEMKEKQHPVVDVTGNVIGRGVGQQWPAAVLGALSAALCAWDLLKEVDIIFITSTIVWSQVKQHGGNTAPPTSRKLD